MAHLRLRQPLAPSELHAALARGRDARARPLRDQASLKLRDCAHHVKHETAARRCRVDAFGERLELAPAIPKRLDDRDQVRQRPPQAIQLPHHQHVARAAAGKRLVETRPLFGRARYLIGKHDFAARRLKGALLQIEVLIVGRYPRIADFHAAIMGQNYGTHKALVLLDPFNRPEIPRFRDKGHIDVA